MQEPQRRVAVILSGGGAKGAYQVGVLKSLFARNIQPAIYSGTSVGAFNAAMLVSGKPLEEIEQLWLGLGTDDIFRVRFDPRRLLTPNPAVPVEMATHSVRAVVDFFGKTVSYGGAWWRAFDLDELLFDTQPLQNLIQKNVDIEKIRENKEKLRLYVALTQLKPSHGEPLEIVDNERVSHAHIHASCALPVIFPSVKIGKQVFCDGGVVMNTPLRVAIDEGAEEIYVVDLTPPPRSYTDATLPMAYQMMSVAFSTALKRDLAVAKDRNRQFLAAFKEDRLVNGKLEVKKLVQADGKFPEEPESCYYTYVRIYVISPESELRGLESFLDFAPEATRKLIRQGEEQTRKILDWYFDVELVSRSGARMKVLCTKEA